MRTRYLAFAMGALSVLGCDRLATEPERAPEAVQLQEIITLTHADGTTSPDGRRVVTFTTTIPRGARTQLITLKTSTGAFILTGQPEVAVRATSEDPASRLTASAVWRADTLPGTTYVRATIEGYTAVDSLIINP